MQLQGLLGIRLSDLNLAVLFSYSNGTLISEPMLNTWADLLPSRLSRA